MSIVLAIFPLHRRWFRDVGHWLECSSVRLYLDIMMLFDFELQHNLGQNNEASEQEGITGNVKNR